MSIYDASEESGMPCAPSTNRLLLYPKSGSWRSKNSAGVETSLSPMAGEMRMYAGAAAPSGWLICDGASVLIASYPALFTAIGVSFGGNGATHFNLPDLRGRLPLGVSASKALGTMGGSEQVTLSTANLPPHTHPATLALTSGSQSVTIPGTTGDLGVTASLPVNTSAAGSATPSSGNNYLAGVSGSVLAATNTKSVNFTGPYVTTKPSGAALPADVSVTGNASTAASTVSIPTITGGSVTVGNNPTTNTPIPTTSPYLAVNFIIAA